MKRPVLITDIDNTLYNFVDFYGPAFRAMLHALSGKTKLPEDILLNSFRSVYMKYQSLEYPYAIQELSVLQQLNIPREKLLTEIIHAAKVAFSRSRLLRLKPYPGVKDTLNWLKRQGYYLIAYTDGPYGHSSRRLKQLGIRQYFDAIVAWGPTLDDLEIPLHLIEDDIKRWFVDKDEDQIANTCLRYRYADKSERKPNSALLRSIISDFNLDIDRSWLVGDSKQKDLLPAKQVGIGDIWARYGREYDMRNWETLLKITPWEKSTISAEQSPEMAWEPTYSIDSFSELQNIIPAVQLSLI